MRTGAEGLGCFPTGKHYPGIAHLLRAIAAGVAEELGIECPLTELPLVAIDTETTGKDPATDRIVEIACVTWKNGAVVDRRHWLVNPGISISKEAFDVHGIGDDDVRDKPPFSGVAEEVLAALSGAVPVAYNAEFDRAFLFAELDRARIKPEVPPPACRRGVDWIDPLIWARELHKLEKGKSLGDVAARVGVEIVQAHRATDDAEATLKVMEAFKADPRIPKTYAAFVQEQRRFTRTYEEERAAKKAAAAAPKSVPEPDRPVPVA
jgi:DNA polymerase III subunit epsilon